MKAGIVMNVFSDTHTDNQINVISVQISTKIAKKTAKFARDFIWPMYSGYIKDATNQIS